MCLRLAWHSYIHSISMAFLYGLPTCNVAFVSFPDHCPFITLDLGERLLPLLPKCRVLIQNSLAVPVNL